MPYSQVTLDQFTAQVSDLFDDPSAVYWQTAEIQSAVKEALLVWGAYTSYWRTRGVFNLDPAQSNPYYDLSVKLPTLRARAWTLDQMVKDIQNMLLENPSGIAGTGMSGQINVESILTAIAESRNRFVMDVNLPFSIHSVLASPPPQQGIIEFGQASVYVHRASWHDSYNGAWATLYRQDIWASDKGNPTWTLESGIPESYSEAENAPLKLQLVPQPTNNGTLEAITVDSIVMDLTNPNTTFQVPDEWVHAIKYAALSYLLYGEGQIKDPLRAEYAEQRYQQALVLAKDARSIIRVLANGVPLPTDSLYSIDAGIYNWRNQVGPPQLAGIMYDMVAVSPGMPDAAYGIAVDVVQSAPLPAAGNDYIQIGLEDIDPLMDYVSHILTFKCGGKDFQSSFSGYDSFMKAVSLRNRVTAAKIKYFTPLFGQAQVEWAYRPDKVEARA